jgi:hypothetical protein
LLGERQELADEARCAVHVLPDLHEVAEVRVMLVAAEKQQIAMA